MKKIIYIMMFVLCVCCNSIQSYATETTEETTTIEPEYDDAGQLMVSTNEKGHVVHGFIRVGVHNGSYWNDYTLNLIGDTNSYIYVTYHSSGTNKLYTLNVVGDCSAECNGFSVQDGTDNVNTISHTNILQGGIVWVGDDYAMCDDGHKNYFLTNLPIFDSNDTTAINNYINNGDYSGADNSSDVDESLNGKRDEFDDTIPLPHNLKILKGVNQLVSSGEVATGYPSCFNKDIVVSWEQEDVISDLQYEMEVCFYYMTFDGENKGLKEYNSAYYPLRTITDYNGSKSITETLTTSQLNQLFDIGLDKLLSKMVFRVRNKCGRTTSNYVSITIDFKKQSASANESAYENDEDVNGEYTDTDINADSSTDGGVGGGDVSLSGVMSFIRDGFGLLGNGGIIALLSSTFLYLPNSIWVMLKFLVAMMVAVCIIKLVKDVVT